MKSQNRSRLRNIATLAAVLAVTLTLAAATSQADTSAGAVHASVGFAPDAPQPLVINYQGRLVNPTTGEAKPDGPYKAKFVLYAVDAGGTPLWSEVQQIMTSKGLFSVTLGNEVGNPIDPALFDGYGRWLSVSIEPDGELLPRIRVAHSPYAIWANLAGSAATADRLGGSLPSSYRDAANLSAGNLSTDRYHAIDDLSAEGFLGNAAGDIALNNGSLQATLNADALDGQQGSFYQNATTLNAGTVSTDRYSAYGDLGAEGYLANAAGDVALNNGVKQTTLNADVLDGQDSTAFAAASHTHPTLPIAYAFILANGSKTWGTSNVTSSWDATNQWYVITISGYSYFYSEFITVVTPICGPGWSVRTASVSGNLLVQTANASNAYAQCGFQFVTYH